MDTSSAERFLAEASILVRKRSGEARRSGLEFNVFDILGLATLEVSGHSAFLAAILNPDGAHGQGPIFLNEFLQMLADVSLVPLLGACGEAERMKIRQACSSAGLETSDKGKSWSVWVKSCHDLNLKYFGPRETKLADPATRKKYADEIAAEATDILNRMRAALGQGLSTGGRETP